MRAVYCSGYGSPDVLSIRDQAIPTPAPDEILIRIGATVAAPADIAFRKGDPFIARFFTGILAPKKIPGDALSGTVTGVGSAVTKFAGKRIAPSCVRLGPITFYVMMSRISQKKAKSTISSSTLSGRVPTRNAGR